MVRAELRGRGRTSSTRRWDGFKEDADIFATADTGDKGRFLGADTTYSIFDEQIIAALGLDLEVVYSGSEDASLSALDTAVQERGADPDVLVDAAVGEREVRPRRGEAPRVHRTSAQTSRSTTRRPFGYNCDYADDVLYKAFSAHREERIPRRSSSYRTLRGRREDQNSVALAIQEGAEPEEGGAGMGGREPGRLASLAAGGLIERSRSTTGGGPRGPPPAFGGADVSEHVRMWISGAWVDAEDGATFDAMSPSTDEVIGTRSRGHPSRRAQRAISGRAGGVAGVGRSLGVRACGGDEASGRGDRRTS